MHKGKRKIFVDVLDGVSARYITNRVLRLSQKKFDLSFFFPVLCGGCSTPWPAPNGLGHMMSLGSPFCDIPIRREWKPQQRELKGVSSLIMVSCSD